MTCRKVEQGKLNDAFFSFTIMEIVQEDIKVS